MKFFNEYIKYFHDTMNDNHRTGLLVLWGISLIITSTVVLSIANMAFEVTETIERDSVNHAKELKLQHQLRTQDLRESLRACQAEDEIACKSAKAMTSRICECKVECVD